MTQPGLSRFGGTRVIVTGAASGIGLATARRFLDEGATVACVDREGDALRHAVEAMASDRAIAMVVDISHADQVAALASEVRGRLGGVDVLVNDAGVTTPGTVLDSGLDAWDEVCATTLTGTISISRTFLPMLIESRGNIVNVASVSGMAGDWNTAYYNVAKAGVVNLTRVMALDHGRSGVRVNAICPSVTRTAMTKEALEDQDFVRRIEARVALGRLGEPEDMAAAITFLASSDAGFITGLIMPVDGGTTASNGQPPFPAP